MCMYIYICIYRYIRNRYTIPVINTSKIKGHDRPSGLFLKQKQSVFELNFKLERNWIPKRTRTIGISGIGAKNKVPNPNPNP